jgi:hypothetical protein
MLQRVAPRMTEDERTELMLLASKLVRQAGYLEEPDMTRYLFLESKKALMLG